MELERTNIDGVFILHPVTHRDERGAFTESFNFSALAKHGLTFRVDQVNVSMSMEAGTVRGMHWQESPFGQQKLVRCVAGEVLDVIVDARPESPTYGQHKSVWLKAGDLQSVYIPHGCAHGWQAIRSFSEIEYLVSGAWNKEAERGFRPEDPGLAIIWPKPVRAVHKRDASWPLFSKP